ncbi:MAG: hypothetical protein NTW75_05930 [Planctomycetales bacterium]|nr:hypothetical protein [Planctomycetales bacterium]
MQTDSVLPPIVMEAPRRPVSAETVFVWFVFRSELCRLVPFSISDPLSSDWGVQGGHPPQYTPKFYWGFLPVRDGCWIIHERWKIQ